MKTGKMKCGSLLAGVTTASILFASLVTAADKVVVIPLNTGSKGGVTTVTSAGQVWMDRNLGALRVATKSKDPDAYGTMYQWGRSGDGHEYRTSYRTSTRSDNPNNSSFIRSSGDWRVNRNDSLWTGESDPSNPCPAGFRIPTEEEWDTELTSWESNDNATGAFASPLRLPLAGVRYAGSADVSGVGNLGYYWSRSRAGGESRALFFSNAVGDAYFISQPRAYGYSVRCIKD